MSVEERLASWREHAEVWAEEICQEYAKLKPTVLPQSALGQAVSYTSTCGRNCAGAFEYAEVELSNSRGKIRCAGPGRTGFDVGSAKAGPKVAAIIESCRMLDVPLKDLPAGCPARPRRSQTL